MSGLPIDPTQGANGCSAPPFPTVILDAAEREGLRLVLEMQDTSRRRLEAVVGAIRTRRGEAPAGSINLIDLDKGIVQIEPTMRIPTPPAESTAPRLVEEGGQ